MKRSILIVSMIFHLAFPQKGEVGAFNQNLTGPTAIADADTIISRRADGVYREGSAVRFYGPA